MTQGTCKERIEKSYKGTIEDLRQLWDAWCEGENDGYVEGLGNICEYGLSFDYVASETFDDQDEGYFRYQLSWGGPSSEFRFYTDSDFNIDYIEYWFLDWFDGSHVDVEGENCDLMEEIFGWFKDTGTVQAQFEEASEQITEEEYYSDDEEEETEGGA